MDRRTKYTKKVIKETFIELLSEKEINKITVSEICTKSDINRATFYRYYVDVYNLLEKVQEELLEEFKNSYTNTDSSTYSIAYFTEAILDTCIKNKQLMKILFNTNNNIYFLNNFLEVVYEKCKLRWEKDVENITEEEIEYGAVFIFNGALGIINYWVKNDFLDSPTEIAKKIDTLSNYGIRKFIYKK